MNKSQVAELKQNIREQLNELKNVVSKQTYRSYEKEYNNLASKTQVIRTENHKLFKLQDDIRTHKENGIATKAKLNEIKKRERNILTDEQKELQYYKKNSDQIVVYVYVNFFAEITPETQTLALISEAKRRYHKTYSREEEVVGRYQIDGKYYYPVSGKGNDKISAFYLYKVFPNSVDAGRTEKSIPDFMDIVKADELFENKGWGFGDDFLTTFRNIQISDPTVIAVVSRKGVRKQKDYDKENHEGDDHPDMYYANEYAHDIVPYISCRDLIQYGFEGGVKTEKQYYSKWVKDNFLPRSCWASLILDRYKEGYESYKNKKGKKVLNYEKLHFIFRPHEYNNNLTFTENLEKSSFNPNGNNGYSFNEVKNFFEEHQLALFLLDAKGNLRNYYEPPSRNKHLHPNNLYVIFTNGHVWFVNDETSIKSLQHKMDTVIYNNVNCPKPSSKYFIKEQEEDDLKMNMKMVKNADDVLEVIESRSDGERKAKETIYLYYDGGDCKNLYFELMKKNIKPDVMMSSGEIRFINLHITCVKGKDIKIVTLKEDGISKDKSFKNIDEFKHYTQVKNIVANNLLSKSYLSKYSNSVSYIFNTLKVPPIIGSIDSIKNFNSLLEVDFNKHYTSIVKQITKVPVINMFDKFVNYNGEKIQDLNYYIVEKLVMNNEYPLFKFNLCIGKNIRGIHNIRIRQVLNVSKIKDIDCESIVKKVFFDETLSIQQKKDLLNHTVGKWNKKLNKKTNTSITKSENEAIALKKIYGGRVIPVENEDTLHFINYIENKTELEEGFRLISTMVYDTAQKEILDLSKLLKEEYGLRTYYIHTDALWIENDEEKFNKFRLFNNFFDYKHKEDYEAIGKLKWKPLNELHDKKPIRTCNLENTFYNLENDNVETNHIEMKDEFDKEEMNEYILKYNNLLIQGFPGTGKSNGCKNLENGVLFIAPFNALCMDIQDDGFNAITCNKLIGISWENSNTQRTVKEYDISEYKTIVFDEIYLYPSYMLSYIKKYIDRHPEIKFIATGDVNQNLPVEPDISVAKVREYNSKIIYSIFKNVITLTKNKRCITEEDRMKMDELLPKLLNSKSKEQILNIFTEYGIKTIEKVDDVNTMRNICYSNMNCQYITNTMMKKFPKLQKYNVGDNLICRKSLQIKKQKTLVNFTYTIREINELTMVLDDGEELIEINMELVDKWFMTPYARTGHSVQGMTLKEEITIFDFHNRCVDKHWIYTALTRVRELKNVTFCLEKLNEQTDKIKGIIGSMIEHHKRNDENAGREVLNEKEYIDIEYAYNLYMKTPLCYSCYHSFDIEGNKCFSINRLNNDLPHIKSNCNIVCRHCNVSYK